jgi:Abnormal spindle-like microcephaly-assoc'd, ASPM-SPD-2-Hydin
MRGISSHSPPRVAVARRFFVSPLLLLAAVVFVAGGFSGCASVSAENHSAQPAAEKISVVPSLIDFKSVVIGQKNSQTVKIINASAASIDLQHLHVSGSGFTLSSAKAPVVLAPGKHVNLSIVFAPANAAEASGSLVIASSDFKAPVKVPLSGSGEKAAAALTASPASINFGSHAVKSSSTQTVTLKNTGNISLSIASINLGGSSFSLSGLAKGVSLSPDQKLEFQVWFHPSASGSSSATLTLDSSSLPVPVKLAVSGSATTASPSGPGNPQPHTVTLDWSAGSSSAKGFHVYRSEEAGGPFKRINHGKLESTSYKDTDVVGGGHYFYVVTAIGDGGPESAFSNEISVEIPIP